MDEQEGRVRELLSNIQRKLKAPKGQFNSFGNYHYRNCEDIIESVKPLLPDGACVIIDDSIEMIGSRYYVKSRASLHYMGFGIASYGYAREPESRKGMDESQITGSTSSYARKYALNGLFLIDDTKDADSKDNSAVSQVKRKVESPSGPPPQRQIPKQGTDVNGSSGDYPASQSETHDASPAPIIWNAGKTPDKGGHRGKDIRDVPDQYLVWYSENGPQSECVYQAKMELDRRDAEALLEGEGA